MRRFLPILLLFVFLGLPQGTFAAGEEKLTASKLGQLAGEVSNQISEIYQARHLMAEQGITVATYGGTSREIIHYVLDRIHELGSVEKFEAELRERQLHKKWIPLYDVHRIASDLDIMVFRKGGEKLSRDEYKQAQEKIAAEFPGTTFYKKFDLHEANEFFRSFPLELNHMETISNIPLSEKGAEHLPQLEFPMDGKKVDLAQHGLNQYVNGELEFRIADKFFKDPAYREKETFRHFLSVLRWIRYLGEDKALRLSEKSREQIATLLQHLEKNKKPEVLEMLRTGNAALQAKTFNQNTKLIEALEKLQIYSRDSHETVRQLEEGFAHPGEKPVSIASFFADAGLKEQRLLRPLPAVADLANLKITTDHPGQILEKPLVIYHRSSIEAIQNMSRGGLWASDNNSIIFGKKTVSAAGIPALYGSSALGATGYGDFMVPITLRAGAVEGKDFIRMGDNYFAILTEGAVENVGSFDIGAFRAHLEQVLAGLTHMDDSNKVATEAAVRGLAGVYDLTNSQDVTHLISLADHVHSVAPELDSAIWSPILQRQSSLNNILSQSNPAMRSVRERLAGFLGRENGYDGLLGELIKSLDFSTPEAAKKAENLFSFFLTVPSAERQRSLQHLWLNVFADPKQLSWLESNSSPLAQKIKATMPYFFPKKPWLPNLKMNLVAREYQKNLKEFVHHLESGGEVFGLEGERRFDHKKIRQLSIETDNPAFRDQFPRLWLSAKAQVAKFDDHLSGLAVDLDSHFSVNFTKALLEQPSLGSLIQKTAYSRSVTKGAATQYFISPQKFLQKIGMPVEEIVNIHVIPSYSYRPVQVEFGPNVPELDSAVRKVMNGQLLSPEEEFRIRYLVRNEVGAYMDPNKKDEYVLLEFMLFQPGPNRALALDELKKHPEKTAEVTWEILFRGKEESARALVPALKESEAYRELVREKFFGRARMGGVNDDMRAWEIFPWKLPEDKEALQKFLPIYTAQKKPLTPFIRNLFASALGESSCAESFAKLMAQPNP